VPQPRPGSCQHHKVGASRPATAVSILQPQIESRYHRGATPLPHTADALHRRSPRPPRRRLVPEMTMQMLPPESWRRWRRRQRRQWQRQRRLPSRRSSRRRHGRLRPSSSLTVPVGGFVGITLRQDQEALGRGRVPHGAGTTDSDVHSKGGNCGLGSQDASFLGGNLRTTSTRRSSRQACRDSAWALDPGRSFGSVNRQLSEFFRLAERLSATQHVLTTAQDQVVLARLRLPAERRSAALQFGTRPSQRGKLRTNSARCTWPLIPCSQLPDGRTKQRGPRLCLVSSEAGHSMETWKPTQL
jgi:hypothetical protein